MSTLAPVAMLFVRCKGGISHSPAESVCSEDVSVAVDVLHDFVIGLAGSQAATEVSVEKGMRDV
jgi:allantoate deiminase